jgi:hypothetical protein
MWVIVSRRSKVGFKPAKLPDEPLDESDERLLVNKPTATLGSEPTKKIR